MNFEHGQRSFFFEFWEKITSTMLPKLAFSCRQKCPCIFGTFLLFPEVSKKKFNFRPGATANFALRCFSFSKYYLTVISTQGKKLVWRATLEFLRFKCTVDTALVISVWDVLVRGLRGIRGRGSKPVRVRSGWRSARNPIRQVRSRTPATAREAAVATDAPGAAPPGGYSRRPP